MSTNPLLYVLQFNIHNIRLVIWNAGPVDYPEKCDVCRLYNVKIRRIFELQCSQGYMHKSVICFECFSRNLLSKIIGKKLLINGDSYIIVELSRVRNRLCSVCNIEFSRHGFYICGPEHAQICADCAKSKFADHTYIDIWNEY